MSDTPETDALRERFLTAGEWPDLFAHARRLERERDEARNERNEQVKLTMLVDKSRENAERESIERLSMCVKYKQERDKAREVIDIAKKTILSIDSLNAGYRAAWKEVTDALGERESGDGTNDLDRVLKAIRERNEARAALREAIQFRDKTMSGYDLDGWMKAAGLEMRNH